MATSSEQTHATLGELLLETQALSPADVNRVLQYQQQANLRFGEAAQRLGLASSEDVRYALARQFGCGRDPACLGKLSALLAVAHQPDCVAAERVRTLRGELTLRWFSDDHRAITLIAPRHGGGASVAAANLALSFAQLGERTLLIDANLRRPIQHILFGCTSANGLSSLLAGRRSLEDSLAPVESFERLTVLCAGPPPPNPHELLSAKPFSRMLEAVSMEFDVVIIDTAPLLEYPDAQAIAARTGGVLLAARRHQTALADVAATRLRLRPTGAAVLGAVLSD